MKILSNVYIKIICVFMFVLLFSLSILSALCAVIIINDDTLLDSTLMCGINDLTDKVEILITNRYGQTTNTQISYINLVKYIKEIFILTI